MAEMVREPAGIPSLYPDLTSSQENLNEIRASAPGASILASVAIPSNDFTDLNQQQQATVIKPPALPVKPKTQSTAAVSEVDFDGNPYPTESMGEIETSTTVSEAENVHWKDKPVQNFVTMKNQMRKMQTTTKHAERHNRPILQTAQSEDDFAGFTADPVLHNICAGSKFKLGKHKEKGVTKFEIRVDDQPHILLTGSEKDQMLNGFSLKVVTLGIVKTRFAFSLNDTQGAKVFECSRGVGMSKYINVDMTYFKESIKCGKIYPTSFNVNRVTYPIYDENNRHLFTFQGGMLRGLFSDGWDLILPDKKTKVATYDKGLLEFKGQDKAIPGTASYITMKQKLLAIACCELIQMHI